MEYRLLWLRHAAPARQPEILVVGDSRIAEGFSARIADTAAQGRLHFSNLGIPGSTPRVWYYAIRDLDPGRNRFAAIVFAPGQYSDQDGIEVPQDRETDLNYAVGRLGLSDCLGFSGSFDDASSRRRALVGCLFKGVPLRSDVRDFLAGIPDRLARTKDWRDHGAGYIDGYGGKPEDLTGLSLDPANRKLRFPPGLKDWQTSTIAFTVTPPLFPDTGATTRYRYRWLGAVLDLYKDSGTRFVFAQIPRAPLPIADAQTPPRFIESMAARPRVSVLPSDTFKDLERPDVFADGLHLNHTGRPIFSARLAEKVAAIVQPSGAGK